MTPKNTFKVTMLVTVDEEYDAHAILEAMEEELNPLGRFHPFLCDVDAEIDEQDVVVEPVRLEKLAQTDTRPVFACISDENGILMYAGRHLDLAEALTAYAKEVGWCEASLRKNPDELEDFNLGHTWYEFAVPPNDWEDWTGGMGPEEYDSLCKAADYEYRDAAEAVAEARARLEGGDWEG